MVSGMAVFFETEKWIVQFYDDNEKTEVRYRAPLNTNEVGLERVNCFTKSGGQKRLLYGAMESIYMRRY